MSRRLQVLLDEDELNEIKQAARERHQTVAEWVRVALREARRSQPLRPAERKLAVVRAASRHEFPTADIEGMLAEIERGYSSEADR